MMMDGDTRATLCRKCAEAKGIQFDAEGEPMAPSKKHFVAIAKAIKTNTLYSLLPNQGDAIKKKEFVKELCAIFAESNPYFDGAKFRAACGVKDE
jgi:hypothetical protein